MLTVFDDPKDGTRAIYFEATPEGGFRDFIRHDGVRLYLASITSAKIDPIEPNSILTGSMRFALGGLGRPEGDE